MRLKGKAKYSQFAKLYALGAFVVFFIISIDEPIWAQQSVIKSQQEKLRIRLITQDNDFDGIPDVREKNEGTNPDDPNSRSMKRLSVWSFDNTEFASDKNQKPRKSIGAFHRRGFAGAGLSLSQDTQGARFNIPIANPTGSINFAPHSGSTFFYFRPDWDSGFGPGQIAPLFSVGLWKADFSYGYWGLTFDSKGEHLFLASHYKGRFKKLFESPIDWKKDQWYLINFRWSPDYASLYINGERAAIATKQSHPLTPDPLLSKKDGLEIIGDRYGATLAKGSIDELEIYNYGMGINNVRARYSNLISASYNQEYGFVKLEFPNIPGKPLRVLKRGLAEPTWTLLKKNIQSASLIDYGIEANKLYEYKVFAEYNDNFKKYLTRSIVVSTGTRSKEASGLLAVVVDESILNSIQSNLNNLQKHWIADGWKVKIIPAPRNSNNQKNQLDNFKKIKAVKDQLKALYTNPDEPNNRLSSIFLVGHVPIPYSGRFNPDGHFHRSWESDLFYGDLVDDEMWTDSQDDSGKLSNPKKANDGVMDQETFPSAIEVPVGRIDFSNLTAFGRSEVVLLKEYLDKIARYKRGDLQFPDKVAGFSSFPHEGLNYANYLNMTRIGGPITGNNMQNIHELNFFKTKDKYLLGVQLGAGHYDTIGNGNPAHMLKSEQIAMDQDLFKVGFLVLDGSYFGNWNTKNNFLRSVLTVDNGGLASIWGRNAYMDLHLLNTGMPIGECVQQYVNSLISDPSWKDSAKVYIQLMGDPTLSIINKPPVTNFSVEKKNDSAILSWDKVENEPVYIEASKGGLHGDFEALTPIPITSDSFIPEEPLPDGTVFRIRRASLNISPSGIWTNLSHGTLGILEPTVSSEK